MAVEDFIFQLLSDEQLAHSIVAQQKLEAREAKFAAWPDGLAPALIRSLRSLGIEQPYEHQAEAIQASLAGRHLVISTQVASGKSLCYQVPIIQSQITNPKARALLLFPTKALARDQQHKLHNFLFELSRDAREFTKLSCASYDGDTPTSTRSQIRAKARSIFSNPDMLHAGILTNHSLWSSFFAGLTHVVIDEVHIYRGVFGSHFANVIRRLKRICALYGSNPQFICTSATVANALSLASNLVEEPVKLIDKDASPRGEQLFCIFNPPVVNAALGIRRSSMVESIRIAKRWINTGGQALLFSSSRRSVEMLYRYLTDNPAFKDKASSYRSGYLPEERRKIEQDLREGKLSLVISTNALELGIDIGGLDAVFINSYPGTISATRQQAGRAGRKGKKSLGILVASSNPLDQYICQHPDYLFDNNPEEALIDPDHSEILKAQLLCAVHELSLHEDEGFGSLGPEHILPHLILLEQDGQIRKYQDRWIGKLDAYPAGEVSLRNIGHNLSIMHAEEMIGTVDVASANWMTHPGAIYLDQGDSYLVNSLDLEAGIVRVSPTDANYYTQAIQSSDMDILSVLRASSSEKTKKYFGNVKVTSIVTAYKRLRYITMELLGCEDLNLPPSILHTQAWWFSISSQVVHKVQEMGLWRNEVNDYGPAWPKLSQQIKERDKFRCQHCGAKQDQESFAVHHIKPFRTFANAQEANQPDNLITLCPRCHRLAEQQVKIQSGLAGLAFLIVNLAPFYVMCDRRDLDVIFQERSSHTELNPMIAIYDTTPGGIGLARRLYDLQDTILKDALNLVERCPCDEGCPSCVGPVAENGSGAKAHAIAILKELLAER